MTEDDRHGETGVFHCTLQVRWADFDQLSHVNNVRFLEYAQEARLLYFRSRFRALGHGAPAQVVRRTELDFLRPVLADSSVVDVEIEVLRVGTTSYTLRHTIRDASRDVCCVVEAVMVAFDPATSSAFEIPADARPILEATRRPELGSGESGADRDER